MILSESHRQRLQADNKSLDPVFYQEIKRNKLNLSQYVISVINKQAWETFKFAALFSDIDLEATFASRPSKWLAVAFSTLAALLTFTLISSIVSYESNNHHRVLIGRLVSLNS